MAAAQEPQPNPYELHPHHTPRAEPGHVHRFVASGYTQRCLYCHVEETFALRAKVAELEATKRRYEDGFLELYRKAGARYVTLKIIRDTCAGFIAIADWQDEQRTDDEEQPR